MSWLDKFKQENIVIQQSGYHNKFWMSQLDQKTFKVVIRWGRLGTKGQSQEKEFNAEYAALSFIRSKMDEKTRKGYQPISKKKFDELCIQAAVVGTSNKCHAFKWVEIKDDQQFVTADELRLSNPECNPGIYVEIGTKKNYNNKNHFKIVFTFDRVYVIESGDSYLRAGGLVLKNNELYELTQKVEEAIGRSLSTTGE